MKKYINNLLRFTAYFALTVLGMYIFNVQAADVISHSFTSQTSSASGSNNSKVSVNSDLKYINKGNNSSIIGNYFSGIYYDTVLGFFKMDWSTNSQENIRVVGSTSACSLGYGYKLGGYAYSDTFGFVDFDYNKNIFVYYCVSDSSLHGFSYSINNGFQNFEGIKFPIESIATSVSDALTSSGVFVNDTSNVLNPSLTTSSSSSSTGGGAPNSNFTKSTIQNDIIEFNAVRESLFYIIK